MARLIEFYVPANFRPALARLAFRRRAGTVIGFIPGPLERYIWLPNGALWPVKKNFPRPHLRQPWPVGMR